MNTLLDQIKTAAMNKLMRMTLDELFDFIGEDKSEFKPDPSAPAPIIYRPTQRKANVDVVIDAILQQLKENADGVSIADLRDHTGFDSPDLRHAVREMKAKHLILTKGEKRSTRYFAVTPKKQLDIPVAALQPRAATVPPPPPAPKGQHPHVVRRPGKTK